MNSDQHYQLITQIVKDQFHIIGRRVPAFVRWTIQWFGDIYVSPNAAVIVEHKNSEYIISENCFQKFECGGQYKIVVTTSTETNIAIYVCNNSAYKINEKKQKLVDNTEILIELATKPIYGDESMIESTVFKSGEEYAEIFNSPTLKFHADTQHSKVTMDSTQEPDDTICYAPRKVKKERVRHHRVPYTASRRLQFNSEDDSSGSAI